MSHSYTERVLEQLHQRNASEPEFLQATTEVLETLGPVLSEHPEIESHNLLERLCEPERQLSFRVTWRNDAGAVCVNRGYRVGFSSALGPYKGGLRFHPSVNLSILKFLGFEQTLKNSMTGLSLGGGKGGADFDPQGRSEQEIMRFCQAFMLELYRHIGPRRDVPAGDMGVGQREIGYLFGMYKKLTDSYQLGVLTGKHPGSGGSLGRKEATGHGVAYFAKHILQAQGKTLEGMRCIVSGAGNVALYTIHQLQALGAPVVACSDITGTVYQPEGINFELLQMISEVERQQLGAYAAVAKGAEFRPGRPVWEVPCEAAFPCATQNELSAEDADKLLNNGLKLLVEGANMPCTPQAIKKFQQAGVAFGPSKAANAGGVAVSALEMQQNAGLETWTAARVDKELQKVMAHIFRQCQHCGRKYGSGPEDLSTGANTAGFLRVAEAMRAHGLI
jgi:glutamate dehydrogenase (NADP+)